MDRTGDPSEWRASNGNLVLGRLPPDGLELLNGSRVEGVTELPGYPPTTRVLQPAEPVNVESGYWLVQSSFKAQPESGARWVNEPKSGWGPGWGLGFDDITERPRILSMWGFDNGIPFVRTP